MSESGNAKSFIKVRGSIFVPSTFCKTSLEMVVVDINTTFGTIQLGQLFEMLTVSDIPLTFTKVERSFPSDEND